MQWLIAILVVVVIGATLLVARGRLGELPEPVDDRPGPDLPARGSLSGADLRAARFAVVPRGYSMVQVDALLARLADQLEDAGVPELPGAAEGETSGDAGSEPATASRAAARVSREAGDDAAVHGPGDAGVTLDAG